MTVTEANAQLPLPRQMKVSYGPMTKDTQPAFHRRVETTLGRKLGGRWRSRFDLKNDQAIFEQRPEIPSMVRHPGAEPYRGAIPSKPRLIYGRDEDGRDVAWTLDSNTVHTLVIGPTGGGKTTFLRSILVGAVCSGIPVYAVDPKRIELRPFEGFPGVGGIASSPAMMADMIERMYALMMKRYSRIERNEVTRDDLHPVLFFLDEFAILKRQLTRLWKETYDEDEDGKKKKHTGTPIWLEYIFDMIFLARSANIRLVIGTQRPDASLFEDGTRDSLQHRVSLSRLSGNGAKMLWGNFYTGTDTPLVSGRAVASPDGKTPIDVQTFWLDDPNSVKEGSDDHRVLDDIADLASQRFVGFDWPISREDFALFSGDEQEPTQDADTDSGDEQGPTQEADAGPGPEDSEDEDTGSDDLSTNGELSTHEVDGGDVETEGVHAESLVVGDQVLLDSGNVAVVDEIEDADDDDDRVLVTFSEYGDLTAVDLDSKETVERVITDGDGEDDG